MERQGDEVHVETDEARGGSTPNVVRWILLISLFAAIVLLSIIWITGAATRSAADSNVEATALSRDEAAADSTDSILGADSDRIDDAVPPGQTGPDPAPRIAN